MCVILTIQKDTPPADLPSRADLRRMAQANPDGLGLAWRRPSGTLVIRRGVPRVRDWIGTILSAARAGCPVVAHARIATVGGTRPALTHPWPVYAPDDRHRARPIAALAHNGHDAWWDHALSADPQMLAASMTDDTASAYLVTRDARYPRDPWSDSRAIALRATVYGLDALVAAPPPGQRLAVLTADTLLETGHGWAPYRGSKYVRVSNTSWMPLPSWQARYDRHLACAHRYDYAATSRERVQDAYGRLWPDDAASRHSRALARRDDSADDRRDETEWRDETEDEIAADLAALDGWTIDDVTGAVGITARAKGGVR